MVNFHDFPWPGESNSKIPWLSRFSMTRTNPVLVTTQFLPSIYVMHDQYGWLCKLARWTKSCALNSYPRGQDGAILPTQDCPLCSRKKIFIWNWLIVKVCFETRKRFSTVSFYLGVGKQKNWKPQGEWNKESNMLTSFVNNSLSFGVLLAI